MIIIDSVTVAVSNEAELKDVLSNDNGYTFVYLDSDIQLTNGITIFPGKATLTIDGLYPTDGTGIIHTLLDMPSADQAKTIHINAASNMTLTIQNLNIMGKNYYGTFSVYEGSIYKNISIIYNNVTYAGPQITFHPDGFVRYANCNITIQPGYTAAHEVGEVHRVEIGGNTTIRNDIIDREIFWYRGSATGRFFTILPNATVEINSGYCIFDSSAPVAFTVSENASLTINADHGLSVTSSDSASFALVDTNASLRIIQSNAVGLNAVFNCQGPFTVNENASVYIEANYLSGGPNIEFMTASGRLNLYNPKSFVLYNAGAKALEFNSTTPIIIDAGQINYWLAATPLENAGTFDDVPLYSWRKLNNVIAHIEANATNALTTISTHNFTTEETDLLPPLSYMQLQNARVLSIGNLPLVLEPITDDLFPITGTTSPAAKVSASFTVADIAYSLPGTADVTGEFTLIEPVILPPGTVVTAKANRPFLISTLVKNSAEVGALILLPPPELIRFIMTPVSTSPILIMGRELPDWSLSVSDTRARSTPWYLYTKMDAPLATSGGAHTLPDAVVFRGIDDSLQALSSLPILIYIGEANGGVSKTTVVSWALDKGVLMQITGDPFINGADYFASIFWILNDSPL